jgi:hypothetical protein
MTPVRNVLIAILALVVLSTPAPAQPPALYGVSWISNDSNAKCTVYYKWGKDGAWKKYVVEKGRTAYFSWAYDGGKKVSPDLYVRIDVDTNGAKYVEHILTRGQSPDNDSSKYGHHFSVKQLKGTDTRYIEAVTRGAKVTVTDTRSTRPNVN